MRSIRIYTPPRPIHHRQPNRLAMIVCVCKRVSDREIARHAHAGMTFDDIQFELGVATQCGQCEGCARDVVAQCSATSHPGERSMEFVFSLGIGLTLVIASARWVLRQRN
jgi:bacterioferritin-associated ferredoxin